MRNQGKQPPSLEALRKYSVNRAGQQESIYAPMYDYVEYAAAGHTQLTFFSNPVGQGTTSHPGSTGPKTRADTNMTNAGLLPNPQRFLCTGIEVKFWPGDDVSGSQLTNPGSNLQSAWNVLKSGYLRMTIGSKDYVTDGPLDLFPASTRLAASVALSDSSTAGAGQVSTFNYAVGAGKPYELSPFLIPSNQNFTVELNWPNAVSIATEARIGVRLLGFLYRLSQ